MVGLGRNGDTARRGHRFKANGDVHAVPEHLVVVRDHISHVDAETELHGPIGRQMIVPFRHQRLHRDGRLDGADDARKLQQEAIAGVLHDAAAMIENDRIYRAAMRLEGGVGARLVGAHHPRVTGHVSADNGSQASLHSHAPERAVPRHEPARPAPASVARMPRSAIRDIAALSFRGAAKASNPE
jgi:hypothetical protein